jgi:NAD(P)-dependent dehydrogenase (short-subunit alcohol dehydrogenase family)
MLTKESLKGKTALVTGAAKRLGLAIANTLAAQGVRIVAHYGHSAAAAEQLVSNLRSRGLSAWAIGADLGSAEESAALFAKAHEAAGSIDILVNSASIFPESRLDAFSYEELDACIRTNAYAPLALGHTISVSACYSHLQN